MSSPAEQLKALADQVAEKLSEAATQTGSDRRREAAARLARRLKQIAASAPEAPADPQSKEAVSRTLAMMRALFPDWNPFNEEDST